MKNDVVLWLQNGKTYQIEKCPWCGEEFLMQQIREAGTNNFVIAFVAKCIKCTILENDAKLAEHGLKRLANDNYVEQEI
jgi:hypothetical protein